MSGSGASAMVDANAPCGDCATCTHSPDPTEGTYTRWWFQGCARCPAWNASTEPSPKSPTLAPLRTLARSPGPGLVCQTGTSSRQSHPHCCEQERRVRMFEKRRSVWTQSKYFNMLRNIWKCRTWRQLPQTWCSIWKGIGHSCRCCPAV